MSSRLIESIRSFFWIRNEFKLLLRIFKVFFFFCRYFHRVLIWKLQMWEGVTNILNVSMTMIESLMKFLLLYFSNLELFRLLSVCPTVWKVSRYGVFSGLYFLVFGLNTEIYVVNLHIQSEYGKIRTKKNFIFGHFSRSVPKWFWSSPAFTV